MRVTVFGATGAVGQHLVQALMAKGDTVTAFMARTFLHRAYDEMIQMSTANTTSDLDWTIVRFMAPGTGQHEAFDESGSSDTTRSAFTITRADTGQFTADQVHNNTYLKAAPAISN